MIESHMSSDWLGLRIEENKFLRTKTVPLIKVVENITAQKE